MAPYGRTPSPQRPPRREGGSRGLGEDRGIGPGRAGTHLDNDDDWRRGMRGQGTGGYDGQYAGMAAGVRGSGRSLRADPAEMVGAYGESGASHRGVGARGYGRRDERIHDDVCARLRRDLDLDARDVEVRVRDGKVTLEGLVTARWARRRAGDLAVVAGVRHVQNNLRIVGGRKA